MLVSVMIDFRRRRSRESANPGGAGCAEPASGSRFRVLLPAVIANRSRTMSSPKRSPEWGMRRSTNGGSIGVPKGDADERHRHLYIIGQTGTGKTRPLPRFPFFHQ